MHILIVTEYFPPVNSMGSGRPYSWAQYLSRHHAVTVVTNKKHSRIYDLSYQKNCSEFELMEFEAGKRSITSKNRIVWAIRSYFKLRNRKFDIVISTSNPWEVHIIPYLLKKRWKHLKWISDFRDLWSLNHELFAGGPSVKRYVHSRLEKFLIKKSDLITTVAENLAEELGILHGDIQTLVIYNGYEKLQQQNLVNNSKFTIVYTGTIYKDRQDPSPLFAAVKALISDHELSAEDIEIQFYGNHSSYLDELIQNSGLDPGVVTVCGSVSRQESLDRQNRSDMLLFLEWSDTSKKGILTGKLFEYLASGTPIIAIGPKDSNSASNLIQETNTGRVCSDDVELIKSTIMNIKMGQYVYRPDLEKVAMFSREYQAKLLEEAMHLPKKM